MPSMTITNIMEITKQVTIGEMVANDHRAATVFESLGISFCCNGSQTLEDACESKKIDVISVTEALDQVQTKQGVGSMDLNFWPLNILADYIEKKHHRFIEDRIPLLLLYLNKLCKVHGEVHRELLEITQLFSQTVKELRSQMEKEESILFPYIRKMLKKYNEGVLTVEAPYFRSVRNPIMMMMQEHEREGIRFEKIASLTNNFMPPADACNTYRVTYALLDEFKSDLHTNIHLVNNILFPKTIDMEDNLLHKQA